MITGPKYPGTVTFTTGGNKDAAGTGWSNPNNVKADDGAVASGDISGGGSSSGVITASNFGFAVPTALKISGIVIEMRKAGYSYVDNGAYLKKSGGSLSLDKAGNFTLSNGIATYGSPTDTWGFTSLTATDVNNTAFSFNYEARNTSGGGNITIDFIRMTVYFAPADKPFDASVRKVYHAKVFSSSGNYYGLLPNVYDSFEYTDEINTAGSDTTILVASSSETARIDTASPLLAEDGTALLTESGDTILTETSSSLIGVGADTNMIVNGNTVVIYEFSPYYPNGRIAFRGRIDKWDDSGTSISVNLKSDGQDLDNSLLTGPPYTYTADQQQLSVNTNDNLYEPGGDKGSSYQRDGQSYTAAISSLGGIIVKLSPTTTIHPTLTVYTDATFTTVLGTVTLTVSSTGGAATDVTFPFAPRLPQTIGTSYYFAVQVANNESCNIGYNSSGGYAGGQRYVASYAGGSGGGGFAPDSGSDLYFKTLISNGATAVAYSAQDPTTGMLVNALSDYSAGGGLLKYTSTSIQASGISVPYSFNLATMLEAVSKFCDLAPSNFYWFVNRGTNLLSMKAATTTPDFIFIKGRHISDLQITPTIEAVKNYIIFTGGEISAPGSSTAQPGSGINLYKIYKDDASIARYGRRIDRVTDNRVTVQATADAIGQSALASQKDEKYTATVQIIDGTIDTSLLEPGKTIGFVGFNNYKDRLVLQISRRNVKSHYVDLTLGVLPVRQTNSIEQINRQLLAEQTVANPATPS